MQTIDFNGFIFSILIEVVLRCFIFIVHIYGIMIPVSYYDLIISDNYFVDLLWQVIFR